MAQLVILREKSMLGMASPMDCYANNHIICKVKNGEEVSCEVDNTLVSFKCNMYSNPMSDTIHLDLSDGKTVHIKIKQGAWKPSITVLEKDTISHRTPSNQHPQSSIPTSPNTPKDLRAALRATISGIDNAIPGDSNGICAFVPTKTVGNYFAIDENACLWAVGKGMFPTLKNATPYHYNDIVDFELLEDGNSIVKGGAGRAFVGGLLFGGIGAVVGSATGKKKLKQVCTNLTIKITVNNLNTPVEYIKLIASSTKKDSLIYKTAYQDAQEILSILQIISRQ